MPSIDERVVAMAFENAKFEAGVAQTMRTLTKLDTALQNIGSRNSLQDIEKAASKVTLEQPMSALDKLRARFGRTGADAAQGMSEIERAGSKVQLEQPVKALNKVQSESAQVGAQAADGFSEIERASNRVNLQGLNSAIDSVAAKFSVLKGAASVALGSVTAQASMRGAAFLKSFSFGPILDGLNEYQTNLKSIQVIQANTDRPLPEINKSLNQLNHYSDQTIYNFSEMARNIGTFTAAGVDLKTATSSIKGIANMAALSGSSSQQAATAMYQLSQAIASGKVGLQDWNSVVNAGMGGKKLQNALLQTGVAMGKIGKTSVKLEGPMKKLTVNGQSFRESIMASPGQQSWLTSDILVNTLATLDGRFSQMALSQEKTKDGLKKYSKAQIEAKIQANRLALEQKSGVKYTDAQFAALQKLSDSAFKSATEVKTLGQVFDVAKETIGSGWAASFQSIFGNLKEAKTLFTGMSNTINGFINANALARNTVLHDWKKLGGRAALIDGLKQAFKDLFAILKPIGQAFRDIFPRKTGKDLADMTKHFSNFMDRLKPSVQTVENIRRTFRGFFAILGIGWYIVKQVIGVVGDLFGAVSKGGGGFLSITGGIGDFLTALKIAIVDGKALNGFFDTLGKVLSAPLKLLGKIASAISNLFGGIDSGKSDAVRASLDGVNKSLRPMERLVNLIRGAWANLMDFFGRVGDAIKPAVDKIVEPFRNLAHSIHDAIQGNDFGAVVKLIQTALLGGIFVALKKGLSGGVSVTVGKLDSLNKVMGALTGNLTAMQRNVQAKTLFTIAAAVGLLAVGVAILSAIDPKKLASAMGGVAVGLGELIGALALLNSFSQGKGAISLPIVAAGMVELAIAMDLLVIAMKILATMSWEEMAKGLVGVGGGLTVIVQALRFGKGFGPSLAITSVGIIGIAIALNILAGAMKIFATMSWEDLAKGLVSVAVALEAIGWTTALMGPELIAVGPGLIAVAIAMNMLAGAVFAFSRMDLESLGKGIGGIGLALLTIGYAVQAIPKTIGIQAAGLVILSVALTGIAGALRLMGAMDLGAIAKSLLTLALTLDVLSVGLRKMTGTLEGSAALLVAAAALAVLVPVLGLLGNFKIETIGKALVFLAVTLLVLSKVGMVAVEGLVALGIALTALAAPVLIVGTGLFLLAKGFQLLGENGAKGAAAFIGAITLFILALPKLLFDLVKGTIESFGLITELLPKVVDSVVKIVGALLDVLIKSLPKIGEAAIQLILAFVRVIDQTAGPVIDAGFRLIQHFLSGLVNNAASIIEKVGIIIASFLNAIANRLPDILDAGFRVLLAFLHGIIKHIPKVISTVATVIATFVSSIADHVDELAAAGAKLIVKVLEGIANNIWRVTKAGLHLVRKFLTAVAKALVTLADIAFNAVITFIDGLAQVIHDNAPKLRKAGRHLAWEIFDAFTLGLASFFKGGVDDIFNAVKGGDKKHFEGLGHRAMDNFHNGLRNGSRAFGRGRKPKEIANNISGAFGGKPSNPLAGIIETEPTITPVLDLTDVHKKSGILADLTNVTPITAARSFGQAATISRERVAVANTDSIIMEQTQPIPSVIFEQHNSSPEALPNREIYRRTNTMLAQARVVLANRKR